LSSKGKFTEDDIDLPKDEMGELDEEYLQGLVELIMKER
jgi:hypothetical protein